MYYTQYAYQQQPAYGQQPSYQSYYYNFAQQQPSYSYYKPAYPQAQPYQAYSGYYQTSNQEPAKKASYKSEYLSQAPTNSGSFYDRVYAFNVSSSAKNLSAAAALPPRKRNGSDRQVDHQLPNNAQNQFYASCQTTSASTHKSQPVHKKSQARRLKKISREEERLKRQLTLPAKTVVRVSPPPVAPQPRAVQSAKPQARAAREVYQPQPKPKQQPAQAKRTAKATGLTATEDVDKLLVRMGYSVPLSMVEKEGHVNLATKEKQDLMFNYGLKEEEFDKAEALFKSYCGSGGKFEIKNLAKVFPNNSLAERIQIPDITHDDGDFLKFEEYLNIYQILKDLDI